jgi:hypothetical protein
MNPNHPHKDREAYKADLVVKVYNVICNSNRSDLSDLPHYQMDLLLSIPYFILAFIYGLHRRKKNGWGRGKLQKELNLTEREAKRICEIKN